MFFGFCGQGRFQQSEEFGDVRRVLMVFISQVFQVCLEVQSRMWGFIGYFRLNQKLFFECEGGFGFNVSRFFIVSGICLVSVFLEGWLFIFWVMRLQRLVSVLQVREVRGFGNCRFFFGYGFRLGGLLCSFSVFIVFGFEIQ